MKFAIAFALAILSINMVISPNPPTTVNVLESTRCGLCRYFNSRDINHLVNIAGYDQVVQITLNPSVHLTRSISTDGSVTFSHQFGSDYLKLAIAQNCANGLYNSDRALRWAAYWSRNTSVDVLSFVGNFFTEDAGSKMKNCINSADGISYTNTAYNIFLRLRKSGMLPQIFLDGSSSLYTNNRQFPFLQNICKQRSDSSELSACKGLTLTELTGLDEECYIDAPTEFPYEMPANTDEKPVFDYEAFWNSPDDD
jgi:hypothetical protein